MRELIIFMNDDIPMWKGEEVVRCGDCKKRWESLDCPFASGFCHTDDDDFCSRGERRGDDDD